MYFKRDIEQILPEVQQSFQVITLYGSSYVVSEIIKSFYKNGIEPKQFLYYYRDIDKKEVDILLVKDGALYPVVIKKGIAPSKPTKNFNVLEKYKMPIKRGMVIDNTEKIRALNDQAFVFPVSLLGI